MLKFIFKSLVIIFFLTYPAHSQNFDNVLVNGNDRISKETVIIFSELPDKNFLDENGVNEILKRLYKSGFFKDVVIKIENNNLIIEVIENPIIQTVFIEGIKRKKTEEALKNILSLKDRSSFSSSSLKNDEINILNFLKNEGYFFSTISTFVQELDKNKIDLFYEINLGKKARISKISFIGEKKYKDRELRNVIVSEEYKFWKFISGKKFLNENLLNFDKRLLYNFYRNKGFYNVNIDATYANFLGDSEFEIIYNISSGKKYYFNEFILKLPLDFDETDFGTLKSKFTKLKGEHYSLNAIDKILGEIDNIVLNEEYEFLNSTVSEETKDNLINLIFYINESEKFYVEKINIYGNNITQENVIRDTLIVDEGDAFNELLHNKTLNNLKSLNFFKKVEADVIEGTSPIQKIINIKVEEKPTGEISAGAGVGTSGGTVGFSVKENNFLGRGIEFSTDLSLSTETLKGKISLNNPNYKSSNRSLNFSAESSVTDRLKNFGYQSNKTGFLVGSGFEFYDNIFLKLGISSFVEKLETDSTASASLKKQEGSFFDTFFNYSLDYDMRDQKHKPTDGFRSKFTQNVPLISENYSLTNIYDFKFYDEWLNENIASYGLYASSASSLFSKDVKLSDRIYIPSSKLRGFESGKIGPIDGSDFVGGNYALTLNVATTLPQILPNSQNTNFSVFFDAANLWGVDYSGTIDDGSKIRSSVGLAVDLFTPIGPLNFSFSEPITKNTGDITESFRFNLGTTF
jgi:outer membrane protein insertion porin family